MPLTPQINLTVNLLDYSGAQIGAAAQPAYLRVMLCGYGQYTPGIAGTGFITKVSSTPTDIPYLGVALSIALFGNDVIAPANTFYVISVLDANKNVVQAVPYQFSGSFTGDLSTVAPYNFVPVVPIAPTVTAGLVTVPYALIPTFDCSLVSPSGLVTFEMTLTGNVTSSNITNVQAGQLVTFILIQDATGGRTFVYPAVVNNTTDINPAVSGITVQSFIARANGSLYPVGPATYN